MPSREEIVAGIYGAWRFARLDLGAIRWFDLSIEGFFKSFFAAVVVAPLYFLKVLLDIGGGGAGTVLLREALFYPVAWLIFPLIMVPIARLLDLGANYVSFIIVYNWAQVPIAAISFPVAIASALGLIGDDLRAFLSLFIFSATLFYVWIIARLVLQAGTGAAAGIVVLDFLTGLLLHLLFLQLLSGGIQ